MLTLSSPLAVAIRSQVSAVHLYQPTFTGPRFLSYHKKPYACSWEMLDWILYECSTTGTLVAFLSFWCVLVRILYLLPRITSHGLSVVIVLFNQDDFNHND